jgi:hypothetical protein
MSNPTQNPEVVAVRAEDAADAALLPTWVLAVAGAAAFTVVWLVGFDNGQLSGVLDGTGSFLHELFHDSRHLFGVPCH